MDWLVSAIILLAVFAASLAATGLVTRVLRRGAILDHPNDRSSHAVPTPRGGGIGVLAILLPSWAAIAFLDPQPAALFAVLAAASALAIVSFVDDLRNLAPGLRLAAHAAAVAAGVLTLPNDSLVFQGLLSWPMDRIAAGVAWMWFVNLFNFMDGIDGIAGAETACIGIGLFLAHALAPDAFGAAQSVGTLGLVTAAAALGFLWWNWAPAQVFLGDVGSVPLGFLLGWLLLEAAAAGAWLAAAILPLYYVADATITLARRLLAGEAIWKAHARHFYQRAARGPGGHAAVVKTIALANLALIALAVMATLRPAPVPPGMALAGAALAVAALLWTLWRRSVQNPAGLPGGDRGSPAAGRARGASPDA